MFYAYTLVSSFSISVIHQLAFILIASLRMSSLAAPLCGNCLTCCHIVSFVNVRQRSALTDLCFVVFALLATTYGADPVSVRLQRRPTRQTFTLKVTHMCAQVS